jgi:hypothetical protein
VAGGDSNARATLARSVVSIVSSVSTNSAAVPWRRVAAHPRLRCSCSNPWQLACLLE